MENRGFGSKLGYILSMAAFSIGIGNLWKFPYVVGNNGGGAFIIVYLAALIFIGLPCFIMEGTLGRTSQLSPMAGMRKLEGGKKTGWGTIGWAGAISMQLINGYAGMIIGGWTLAYVWKLLTGQLSGLSADEIGATFGAVTGSWSTLFPTVICLVLLLLCLISGVKKGVEKVCSILLPALLVILIGLAIYANCLPGAAAGLKWYVVPDFSKINMSVISAAVVQVFFSVGVGMCCAFVYGSYIKKDTNLVGSLTTAALMDTGAALLSGFVCVPALFAFGIEPSAGPSLIFVTLPNLFNAMGGFGRWFGLLFMLCVFAAGFTSMLGGAEAVVACLTDSTKLSRKKASVLVIAALFVQNALVLWSFIGGPLASFKCLNLGFFDFADFLSSGVGLSLGAVLIVAYVIFKWGWKKFQAEANEGAAPGKAHLANWMKWYFLIVLPILLLFAVYCIITTYV